MTPEELRLYVLRKAEKVSNQQELARELGLSVGKTNYIIREMVKKGLLKMERFSRSKNKLRYRYLLTPKGILEKIRLMEVFIERKRREYEELQRELRELQELNRRSR